jgi:hypothetical protein
LEALTVLFQAFWFLAVAALQVPLLTWFGSCVWGRWLLWLLLLGSKNTNFLATILKFGLRLLAVHRVHRTIDLIMCWLFIFLTRIVLSLILWLICVSRFVWLRCDFGSESLRISLQNIGYGLCPLLLVITVVLTVRAMAMHPTILSTSKAFAI